MIRVVIVEKVESNEPVGLLNASKGNSVVITKKFLEETFGFRYVFEEISSKIGLKKN